MRRHFGYFVVVLALCCAGTMGQQRPQPPARQAPGPGIGRQPAPTPVPNAGGVEGYVYWNANSIAHNPAGSCSGLAVTVKVGSSSGGPFEAYKPMTTRSNNFQYAGQVKAFLSGGKIEVYDVCRYAYDHVPVGADLQVQLTVPQPAAFSPSVAPQFGTAGPIKIDNGQCNMLPKAVPSSLADLTAHWGSCQNRAYNVNFELVRSALSSGGSGGLLSGSGGVQPRKNPGTVGTPVLINPGPINTPLLKQSGPVQNSPASTPGETANAGGAGGSTSGTKPGTTVPLNPQPLPPNTTGTATRATGQNPLKNSARFSLGPKITISGVRARGLDQTTAQTIQSESLATHNVRAAMLGGTQPGSNSNLRVGPSSTLDSRNPATGGSTGQPGTGSSGGNNPVQASGTLSTQGGGGSSSAMQKLLKAPAPLSPCRFTTDPVIETVGGKVNNIVLTPDPGTGQYPNNQYAIVGCNFGDVQGDVRIFGSFINNPSPVHLGIDLWTDSSILVTFMPTFQNEYDVKNITLVVVRKDGKSAQRTGISFVATRASRPLLRIPRSVVRLPDGYFHSNAFVSPISAVNLKTGGLPEINGLPVGPQAGTIAFYLLTALWDSKTDDGYPPSRLSYSDAIDFSKLRPGFTLDDNAQPLIYKYAYGDSCKYVDTVVSASMQGSTLLVGVQPQECDKSGKFIYAYYGLILSVTGPNGDKLDPWPDGLQ